MTGDVYVNLAVEDVLSEAILRRIIHVSCRSLRPHLSFMKHGKSYLRKGIRGFNLAAHHIAWIVLTDLDETECAPMMVEQWLPTPRSHGLAFCIAVRETEAWLLADKRGFSEYFEIPEASIPADVERQESPKELLITLANRSRLKKLREEIVPPVGSGALYGRNYNGRLGHYVHTAWSPARARQHSVSLDRAILRISALQYFTPH